jgi:hypothetical protein
MTVGKEARAHFQNTPGAYTVKHFTAVIFDKSY